MATLARHNGTIQDLQGNAIKGAQVTVYVEGGGSASLFSDRSGLVPLSNPVITADDGSYFYNVIGGAYREVIVAPGMLPKEVRFVAVGLSAETDNTIEEGATTPTLTAAAGTITTSSCALSYSRVGNLVTCTGLATITTVGTGTGNLRVPLPFTAHASKVGMGTAKEVASTNIGGTCRIAAGATYAEIAKQDGTTFLASTRIIQFAFSYFI